MPFDESLAFQGLQMPYDPIRRPNVECVADLTDRRSVAAIPDLVSNEFVDPFLAFR